MFSQFDKFGVYVRNIQTDFRVTGDDHLLSHSAFRLLRSVHETYFSIGGTNELSL